MPQSPKPQFNWVSPPAEPNISQNTNEFLRWVQSAVSFLFTAPAPQGSLIGVTLSPSTVLTGAELTITTITIPGKFMGAGKGCRARVGVSHIAGAAATTLNIYFGGQRYASVSATAFNYEYNFEIFNDAGTTAKQTRNWARYLDSTPQSFFGIQSALSQDTTQDVPVRLTLNGLNTDTVRLYFLLEGIGTF